MYGPVRTVVWQGSVGDRRPYADQTDNAASGIESDSNSNDGVDRAAEEG